ncbi:AraC family transcriptional regulator [Paenibacillus harenae]|uniref:AraC family transcriptional regulator n=1 Tax=Paenibacillus harenae TaxID=306543 RepID=UPI0027902F1E|nr:AraC family transcriptional regulator [Paenibacillus harenae]MDQ0064018.1 AraC family L-rhamnose operon transcriptional activator RhaR [Paenibacillus harenae]
MIQWNKSEERLNRQAGLLQGERLTFHVHYWGVVQHLQANQVHKHSFYEICYVDGGKGVYEERGRSYPLYEGTLFCSRPGISHQIRDVGELNLFFVAFEPDEKFSDADELLAYMDVLNEGNIWHDGQALSPAVQIWKSLLVPRDISRAIPDAVLPQLASGLLESFPVMFGTDRKTASQPVRMAATSLIRRAKQYIRDNLDGSLTLPEVARQLNISERHLSRLFSSHILESYTDVVKNERIRAAERLLLRTRLPIKEIAEQVGFSSVHYFTRIFSKAKGTPPAAYREANAERTFSGD